MSLKCKCPKCGSERFYVKKLTDYRTSEIIHNNSNISINSLEEQYTRFEIKCLNQNCDYKTILYEESPSGFRELLTTKCSQCNCSTPDEDLDENGICPICIFRREKPDLAENISEKTMYDVAKLYVDNKKLKNMAGKNKEPAINKIKDTEDMASEKSEKTGKRIGRPKGSKNKKTVETENKKTTKIKNNIKSEVIVDEQETESDLDINSQNKVDEE